MLDKAVLYVFDEHALELGKHSTTELNSQLIKSNSNSDSKRGIISLVQYFRNLGLVRLINLLKVK